MNKVSFLVCGLMFAPIIHAQENVPEANPSFPHQQSIALNPIFAPLGTITAEYERVVFANNVTVGISGWYEYNEVKARWIYLKGMYYTGGSAFSGFAVGIVAGMIQSMKDPANTNHRADESSPIVGGMIHYNWNFGIDDHILIGTGLGIRTALKKIDANSPLSRTDGELRLVTGYIF